MFRKNKNQERIEPSFDGPRKAKRGGMRLDENDRTLPSDKPAKRVKKVPNARKASGRSANRQPRKRSWLFGFPLKLAYWGLVMGLWGGIVAVGIIGYYAAQLPQSADWRIPQRPPNAKILSVNGKLIANRGQTGGASVSIDEMSPYIPMAVIAIEDHRYKYHFGFDPIGFSRAMFTNLRAQRMVQGGSTLTQQLAKNMFLKPERTIGRKVQELILAVWLETQYTKDEILELYLNRVYFGSGATGVDAAARRYFNKSARDVNLAEAATIAGLLKAPSRLSPAKNPDLAKQRSKVVLAAMLRENFITEEEAKRAMEQDAKKAKRYWSGSEHYAADMVMKHVKELIGEMHEDLIVDTTVDLSLQKVAEKTIKDTIAEYGKKRKVSQGAAITMTPRGAIRAVVGGREYADSQYNRATEAKRQPGSAFKPFVYLAALEAGRTPMSVRQDLPVKIGKWTPMNYDRKFRGPVTLQTALAKSLNTIAAQLAMEVGPKDVVVTAHRVGLTSKLEANASIALGTSEVSLEELTQAYASFANGGYAVKPYIIKRISTVSGKVLYERKSSDPTPIISPREVGMMNYMLRKVITSGTGKAASLGDREAAGKTGTTQNSRDAIFVGYTADYVTGVWYGNDDGSNTKKVTGGSLPAKSWKAIMKSANSGLVMASLPGNYAPEQVASVPVTKRLQRNLTGGEPSQQSQWNGQLQSDNSQIVAQPNIAVPNSGARRTLSEIDGPRPSANVGEVNTRPRRTILDLILGN